MFSWLSTARRLYSVFVGPPSLATPSSTSPPIKFGILGAAKVASTGLIIPALSHPEVEIHAVAARDPIRAEAFAKKYKLRTFYGGGDAYQKLLDDPEIQAVYVALPGGLHYEWTMKALAANKHVLVEKPSSVSSEQTREMFEFAQKKGLVILEGLQYRFYPAIIRAKEIIDSGSLKTDDIRYTWEIGGGIFQDMGTYPVNVLRYFTSSEPTSVLSASYTAHPNDPKVDQAMTTTLAFPGDVVGSIELNFEIPYKFGLIPSLPKMDVTVKAENGEMTVKFFVLPFVYHSINVSVKDGQSGKGAKKRTEKVYSPTSVKGRTLKGEEWWASYRYQLEAFVDKVKGREPDTWLTAEESIANLQTIEKVYEKAGLPPRPKSTFAFSPITDDSIEAKRTA
ncbi:unnamed protein product [Somion occarium]|uniref:D-xylose 1-dehydrogenase (NADP(+), D-xylono-1,5-lactone-forming) n=1 Tax=Somion occarium TaxID=3059160 RepID=A0ABP1DLL3_9APHY